MLNSIGKFIMVALFWAALFWLFPVLWYLFAFLCVIGIFALIFKAFGFISG